VVALGRVGITNYPKCEKFNVIVVEDDRGQSDEEVPSHVNLLQLLNALSVGGNSKGLSYGRVEMNGNGAKAMPDTGTTHNFFADRMV